MYTHSALELFLLSFLTLLLHMEKFINPAHFGLISQLQCCLHEMCSFLGLIIAFFCCSHMSMHQSPFCFFHSLWDQYSCCKWFKLIKCDDWLSWVRRVFVCVWTAERVSEWCDCGIFFWHNPHFIKNSLLDEAEVTKAEMAVWKIFP